MVPLLLLHPETLHSLKFTPTLRPQDHSTDLTCWVNLQGSQVTMERAIQLNVSCECGGVAENDFDSYAKDNKIRNREFDQRTRIYIFKII